MYKASSASSARVWVRVRGVVALCDMMDGWMDGWMGVRSKLIGLIATVDPYR